MIKHLLSFCLFATFLVANSGCGTVPPPGFTSDGCPSDTNESSKKSANLPSNINVFLETSGSMFGFMPASTGTEFQTDMWRLISSLNNSKKKGLTVYQVKDTQSPMSTLNISSFRDKMNSGEFQASTSTDIPSMLDSVLSKIDKGSVSILISDLIFSPENIGNTAPKLAQITTDVRSRFEGRKLSSALYHFSSDFIGRNVTPKQSPYYVWIIGEESAVVAVSKIMKINFPNRDQINFGISPRIVDNTIVPGTIKSGNALAIKCRDSNRYYSWSNYNGDELDFSVALNLSDFPKFVQDPGYLKRNIEFDNTQLDLELVSIESGIFKTSINNADYKLLEQLGATHLVNFRVKNVYEEETVVNIRIKNEFPNWVNAINSPVDDLSRTKTYGLLNMINGLDEAYKDVQSKYVSKPFPIWISKNTID